MPLCGKKNSRHSKAHQLQKHFPFSWNVCRRLKFWKNFYLKMNDLCVYCICMNWTSKCPVHNLYYDFWFLIDDWSVIITNWYFDQIILRHWNLCRFETFMIKTLGCFGLYSDVSKVWNCNFCGRDFDKHDKISAWLKL